MAFRRAVLCGELLCGAYLSFSESTCKNPLGWAPRVQRTPEIAGSRLLKTTHAKAGNRYMSGHCGFKVGCPLLADNRHSPYKAGTLDGNSKNIHKLSLYGSLIPRHVG